MKCNILFFGILTSLTVTDSLGQKSIVKLQIGYGVSLTNSVLTNSTSSNTSGATYTGIYGSYGSGLYVEGGYIYLLNTHLSLELDGAYLAGKHVNATYTSSTSSQRQSDAAHFYEISPLLRVNLGGTTVKPYAALGPVFGFGNIISNYLSSGSSGSDVELRYSGSVAIGVKSAIGAELTKGRFIFYTQLTMISMNYAPAQSVYTRYTIGGVDQLTHFSVSQKQTVYKSSYYSGTQDPNQPTEQLKFYIPLNSISLNVGVMFKF